nr:MAG TPA: hypothetical protein [Caudoviricetes sp.]
MIFFFIIHIYYSPNIYKKRSFLLYHLNFSIL